MARTEAEVIEGVFPVQIGGQTYRLPELSYGEARAWSRAVADAFGPVMARFEDEYKPGDGLLPIERASEQAMDAIVGLLLAYDATHVLSRELIERMTSSAIFALWKEVYAEAHPFGDDLQMLLTQVAMARVNAQLARLAGESSTSGASPTGASPRATSAPGSPRANSNSSGARRRNGSAGKAIARSGSHSQPGSMPS